jgi:peptidoglycan hydrolase-like protein with peptidoglycan-binding domain
MRNIQVVFAVFVSFPACVHANTVGSPTAPNPPDAPTRLPNAAAVTPKKELGHPQLATSPVQVLAPGAVDTIAEALRKRGLLPAGPASGEALEKAVRAFQESQGLAATGFPDQKTLSKLGLDPRSIDRIQ